MVRDPTTSKGAAEVHSAERDEERKWVEAALRGDASGFDAIYRRYAPPISRRLQRVFARTEDVEDVLQTTFLEVHRSLGRCDPARSLSAWLHGIAFRVAGHCLRGRHRWWWQPPNQELVDWAPDPEAPASDDWIADRQLMQQLFDAMTHLNDKQRIAFAMHELEGLGLAEVGELVGASAQTVWARVQAARKILLQQMEAFLAEHRGKKESP